MMQLFVCSIGVPSNWFITIVGLNIAESIRNYREHLRTYRFDTVILK